MNTAQAMPWWGWIFFAGFFLLLRLTGVMFISILRQGDERRRLILLHAGAPVFSPLWECCCVWRSPKRTSRRMNRSIRKTLLYKTL